MTYDAVNPSHYHGDRKHEPIQVIEDWNLNYRLGCALKYISRNGRKPGEDPREGLRKAIWYLEREIEALDTPGPYSVQYQDVLRPTGSVRVYELAKELGLSNREVLEACDSLGVNVKSHSSSLGDALASKLRGFLSNRGVQYEDVLDYYGQTQDLNEAWPQAQTIPFDASDVSDFWTDDEYDFYSTQIKFGEDGLKGGTGTDTLSWDSDDDYMWDPTLGPVEVSSQEVEALLAKKDLNQFGEDEIVSTVERRGMIIGFKKDGSSCVLKNGKCA